MKCLESKYKCVSVCQGYTGMYSYSLRECLKTSFYGINPLQLYIMGLLVSKMGMEGVKTLATHVADC